MREVLQLAHFFDWDPWDPEKSQEYENLKIDMILNPFVVLGPINSVFDNFSRFRQFSYFSRAFSKMDLKIENFDFLQPRYFWKAGVEPFSDLPKFFRSEVI